MIADPSFLGHVLWSRASVCLSLRRREQTPVDTSSRCLPLAISVIGRIGGTSARGCSSQRSVRRLWSDVGRGSRGQRQRRPLRWQRRRSATIFFLVVHDVTPL